MQVVQDYIRRAEDTRKLAIQAEILEHRKAIQRISDTWARLAEERLKFLKERNKRDPNSK